MPLILAGLPAGVTMTRVFVANASGVPPMTSAATALSIDFWSAVASTSAASPCDSCSTRMAEESKESVTSTSGCAFSNVFSSSVNGSVSDAAASTRSVDCLVGGRRPSRSRRGRARRPRARGRATALHGATSIETLVDLTRRPGERAGLEREVVGRLAADQRDDAVGAAGHLDLRHHAVLGDLRDDAAQAVAGARRPSGRGRATPPPRRRAGRARRRGSRPRRIRWSWSRIVPAAASVVGCHR